MKNMKEIKKHRRDDAAFVLLSFIGYCGLNTVVEIYHEIWNNEFLRPELP